MPAPDVRADSRGRPLLAALFWIGVVLAPIAAGLLLIAKSNGTLRIAAVLAVLSVVLIGLSVALRGDAETVRQELEETLFDELDELHKGVRNDIETAARTTHRAFSEKLQLLQNQVEVLRGQLEQARAELERRGPVVPERAADFVRHGEPAGHGTVGRHQPNDGAAAGQPSRPAYSAPGLSNLHPQAPSSRSERTPASASRSFDASVAPPPVNVAAGSRPPIPGVVRHTETVHVTTRHTIVDQPGEVPGPGTGHGRVYGAQDADAHWAPEPPIPAATGPGPDRWAPEPRQQRWDGADDGRFPYDRPGPEPDEEAGWSDLRAGDRWAAVRADEQGRELRMGERRAAVRADGSGTELRIEDRWAAVRRDGPGWDETGREPGAGGRALPAGESPGPWQQPSGSWGQRWEEPEREPVRRGNRHRGDEAYGSSREERPSAGGRAPRVDFDPSDDRWR